MMLHPARLPLVPQTPEQLTSILDLLDGDGSYRYGSVPADVEHDNARHAMHAAHALIAYAQRTGGTLEELSTVLGDLVADLLHLTDALGVEMDAVLDRARGYYEANLSGGF